jgi:hypothetical protein
VRGGCCIGLGSISRSSDPLRCLHPPIIQEACLLYMFCRCTMAAPRPGFLDEMRVCKSKRYQLITYCPFADLDLHRELLVWIVTPQIHHYYHRLNRLPMMLLPLQRHPPKQPSAPFRVAFSSVSSLYSSPFACLVPRASVQ